MPQQHVKWYQSIVFRLALFYAVVPLIVIGFATLQLRAQQEHEVQDKFGFALQAIAASTAPHIDPADLKQVYAAEHADLPQFRRLRSQLEKSQRQNSLADDQIYILRPSSNPDIYRFAVMLQDETFIGDPYRPPPAVRETYEYVLKSHKTARTPLYRDDHGAFISGIAPIFDNNNETIALIQTDYSVDKYLHEVERSFQRLLLGVGALAALLLLIGFFVRGYIQKRIRSLTDATTAIANEEYDHKVNILGSDELAVVGNGLARSLEKLKERFEMLKFLPRHTKTMIQERAQEGVSLQESRRVHVAILESDIRGFTKLSDGRDPQAIINMLNIYVSAQAELVSIHGGSVDKFMGDAMLAVFEGDGCEKRALFCASDIQRRITELNELSPFHVPVQIGIGIAAGEVVMGNMGSDDRMEHTVIGSTVNLAARLCSAAEAGTIVAPSSFDEWVDPSIESIGSDEVAAKGFSKPIQITRLKASTAKPTS